MSLFFFLHKNTLDWVNQTKISFANVESYTCNSPDAWKGHPYLSFDRTKINCVWFNLTFVISLSVASGLVILTICIIIYRKRWWILFTCCRLKCHGSSSHGYQRLPLNAEDRQGWSYDAYISYSGDDYDWVLKHLLPGIDFGELTEEQPFKEEFFHDRDSVPGSSVSSNMLDNMEKIKKVIIVLTKKYLSSDQYKSNSLLN